MEAGWSARRVARQLGRSDCVETSGSERSHLHEDQAQDALDRSVVEKTTTSEEMHASCQLLHRPPSRQSRTLTRSTCFFSNHTKAPG
ncbi:hypothetical protein TNCV_4155241 [Trichonephila clavipes]|nr:hypothetical protein TNCV_4155241 [Trichonephila clavipes]